MQIFYVKKIQSQKSSGASCKKTCFLHFKGKYLTMYLVKIYEISSTHFYTSLVQDPKVRYAKKQKQFKKYFALCNINGSLSVF